MPAVDISIVIVSHNHGSYLESCLLALEHDKYLLALEVFVVDNRSTDDTVVVVGRHPWVHLVQNRLRYGFSTNNNIALRQSHGRYSLLLNPDTIVQPGALKSLLTFMDTHPEVGICGPQLVFPDGQVQPSCRRFPTLASVLARRTPFRRWLWDSKINARHLMQDFDHSQTREVDWMLGACLMTRREYLQTVGLMDEGFFLYVEDIDWCYRAKQAGWKVVYLTEARITHHHLAKSDRVFLSRYSWLHLQSMWRYYRKHLAPGWLRLHVVPAKL